MPLPPFPAWPSAFRAGGRASGVLDLFDNRRRRPELEPYFTPEEEESALRKVGGMAVGGISAASAGLDIPAGAIRNILSGRLPSHRPLSWEGRTTGRELLEQYGILGRNRPGFIRKGGQWYDPTDWDWGDIAGFATEVALDPLTYLTFGGSAVGKAGKALKAAGLWDFVPAAARKKGLGRMAARQQLTPKDVLKSLPKDIRRPAAKQLSLQAKQAGVPLTQLWKEPLGGGMRFWPTGAVIGKAGGVGGKVADILDPVGEMVRFGKYSPVRPAYAMLSKPMRGKTDPIIQRTLAARHVEGEFRVQQIRTEAGIGLSRLKEGGHLTQENIAKHRTAVEWKVPEGMTPEEAAAIDPILNLPKGIARESVLKIRVARDRLLKDERFAGLATDALEDMYAEYARRGMYVFDTPLAEIGAAQSRLRASHPSQISREDVLKNWKTGSEGINAASIDFRISGTHWRDVIGPKMSTPTRGQLESQYQIGYNIERPAARELVRAHYPRTSAGGANLDEAVRIFNDDYGHLLPDKVWSDKLQAYRDWTTQDAYNLAEQASKWDPQHVSTQIPLFGHHPSFDALNREIFSAKATTAAHAIYDMAAEHAVRFQDAPLEGRVSLARLLKEARLTGSGAHGRMIERLPELIQKNPDGTLGGQIVDTLRNRADFGDVPISSESVLNNIYVPQSVANDIIGLGKAITDPATLRTVETAVAQFWDSWINLFKGHVTAYWPAFVSRNFISGQLQNQIGGAYGANPFARHGMAASLNDIWQVMRGRDIPDVLDIPMVKAAGITDPHEGTRMVLSALSGGQIGGRYQMEHAAPIGIEMASRGVEEFLGGMPWGAFANLNIRKRPGRNWWKFWAQRGVGTEFLGTGPKRHRAEFILGVLGEDAGYVTETLNRFAPGVAMLRQGIDPHEVVKRVKLLQVDYMNQALADKHIRRALPFWSFIKGMSTYMATELSQRPGGPLAQTIRAEATMQREGLPPVIPEHVRQTAAIPLGETPEGGQNILTSLGMMHEDPLQFLGGIGGQGPAKALTSMVGTFGRELTSRLAPQASVPIELTTGVSTWQAGPRGGRALVDQYGHLGGMAGRILDRPVKFHPAVEEIPQLLGAGRWISSAGKFIDPRKTKRQKALNLLTGAHLTTVSPQQQERVIRDTLEEMMTGMGARQYQRAYFPAWHKEQLSPGQLQKVTEAEAIQKALDRKIREHKMKEVATQP